VGEADCEYSKPDREAGKEIEAMNKTTLKPWEETLEVVLEETVEAARDFEAKLKQMRALKPDDPDYEGRYGELAAAAFLLKLKAEAAYETLERVIEAEPDEEG